MLQTSAGASADAGNEQIFLYHRTKHWWATRGEQELKQIDTFIQKSLKLPDSPKMFGGPKWGVGPKWGSKDYINSCAIDTVLFLSLWWWDDSILGQGLKQRVYVRDTQASIFVGHFQNCLLKLSNEVADESTPNGLMNDLKHCFWFLLASERKSDRLNVHVLLFIFHSYLSKRLLKKRVFGEHLVVESALRLYYFSRFVAVFYCIVITYKNTCK